MDHLRSVVEFTRDPYSGYERHFRRFGSVSTLGVGPWRYTYLLGPEANRFISANSQLFSWREAMDVLVPIDGETALIVSDGDDHQRRRRLVQPAFHRRQIDGYVATMAANADAVMSAWRPGMHIDLYQGFRQAIRRSTIELLFGERLVADEPVLGERLQVALDLLDLHPALLPVRRVLPAYRRAVVARAEVDRLVRAEIERRRTGPGDQRTDVLTALMEARDEDGGTLTDVEIVDQVISLIAAGYETTSAALAWAMLSTLREPGVWQRAHEEVRAVVDDECPLTATDLPRLEYLDGVVHESLRLYPPGVVDVRKAVAPFSFAGHRIPAGRFVVFSPYLTHRLPEVWPDPLRFDPASWDPSSEDYRKPGPHEFLPFGGGPHRCIGATLATVELKTMLAQLVRRASLRLDGDDHEPIGLIAMRPKHGVRAEVLKPN